MVRSCSPPDQSDQPPESVTECDSDPAFLAACLNELDDDENNAEPDISSEYYLEDGDLFILVEHTVFRVHSYFIHTHSPLLSSEIKGSVGTTLEDPLKITLVAEDHFRDILWVLYDETFERVATSIEWLAILLTAEKLQMKHVINLAVNKLKTLPVPDFDAITLIIVQERYHIREDWALEAYLTLCKDVDPLDVEEAESLGCPLTVLIFKGREAALKAATDADKDKAIKEVLKEHSKGKTLPNAVLESPLSDGNGIITSGNVTVKAGKLSFQVHKHFLSLHSPLHLARRIKASEDGISSKDPIHVLQLEGVDERQFSCLIWLFYDKNFAVTAETDQWIALRDLAQKFSMNRVGAFATKQLGDSLDLIERVYSVNRFKMTGDWADEVMDLMYGREEPPSAQEGSRLGYALLTKIWMERERRLREELEGLGGGEEDGVNEEGDEEVLPEEPSIEIIDPPPGFVTPVRPRVSRRL